jgi:hypothetical protein
LLLLRALLLSHPLPIYRLHALQHRHRYSATSTMLYSTLIVAASAIAGASAQLLSNGTRYDTPIPCCTVAAGLVPADRRSDWCEAQKNTCNELCGGVGKVASNGNNCDKASSSAPSTWP